jgi:pyruvate dehydrogenase E1 component alpha subunit
VSDESTVAQFSIPWRQILNEKSVLVSPLPETMSPEKMVTLYEMMTQMRVFDRKAIALQRTGKLGTYPSTLGAEAFSVGVGMAMESDDVLCPYYRDVGAQLLRGVKMEEILLYWGGDERGSAYQACPKDFPICVPIASQTLYATGAAFAFQCQKKRQAVVATIGDGGTSRGDFYEAMNVAGLWKLPIVFVINNNQWAISVPRGAQSGAQTLAQKGIAAGINAIQIDGNDVLGVEHEVSKACQKARDLNGPSVIEVISYRMSDHTTADDASRYRPAHELTENEEKDPIRRLKSYLTQINVWDESKEAEHLERCSEAVEAAVQRYLQIAPQSPESAFEHLYETLPEAYLDQWENLKGRGHA